MPGSGVVPIDASPPEADRPTPAAVCPIAGDAGPDPPDIPAPDGPAAMSVGRRTAIGASWLIGWRFATRGLGLISMLILARLLVPADFGLITMAYSFSAAVEALSQIGAGDALVRHPDPTRRTFDTAFTLQVARGLLNGCAIACLAPLAATWYGEPRLVTALAVFAVLAVATGAENIGMVEYRRALRFDAQVRLLALPRLLQFVVTTALALLTHSYWALLAGIATERLARLRMTYAMHPHRPRLTLACWRELAGFSTWSWLASLAYIVWNRSDPFIVGGLLGSGAVGVFALSVDVAILPITELVAPAAEALFAGFSRLHVTGDDPIGRALPVTSVLLIGVVPIAIGLSATSGYLVASMLGTRWLQAGPLIAVLAGVCLFSPVSYVCSGALTARGMVRRNFYIVAVAALARATAVYAAARTGDLRMVAAAAVFAVAVEASGMVLQLRLAGRPGLRIAAPGLARTAAAAALTAAILWATGLGWATPQPAPLPALAVGLPLGLTAMVLFWALLGLFWIVSGRPAGPESRLVALAGDLLGPRWPAGWVVRLAAH